MEKQSPAKPSPKSSTPNPTVTPPLASPSPSKSDEKTTYRYAHFAPVRHPGDDVLMMPRHTPSLMEDTLQILVKEYTLQHTIFEGMFHSENAKKRKGKKKWPPRKRV